MTLAIRFNTVKQLILRLVGKDLSPLDKENATAALTAFQEEVIVGIVAGTGKLLSRVMLTGEGTGCLHDCEGKNGAGGRCGGCLCLITQGCTFISSKSR